MLYPELMEESPTKADAPQGLSAKPPGAWLPLLRAVRYAARPFERFVAIEAASGILLLLTAAVALLWANSPWKESYTLLWETPLGVRLGPFAFERSLAWFVNDGLMAIFFFVIGLEIRREMHQGELSDWKRASLPLAAAFGGVLVPAGLYLLIAGDPAVRMGWGVPMATDIAFALGIITLLGKRAPASLRVLLLALAVIDDLIAILVIAVFYSSGVSLVGFLFAGLGIFAIFAMQWLGIRPKLAYLLPSLVAWAGIYAGGVHPTIAGVIIGMVTPVRTWFGRDALVQGLQKQIETLVQTPAHQLSANQMAERLRRIDVIRREAMSPAESLIEALHPWVAYCIMPIFALANAGVALTGMSLEGETLHIALGSALGLLVGKPLGIVLAVVLMLRLGLTRLPAGLYLRHVLVLGMVAGIGFTMALFIAQLAFADPVHLSAAKLGVLVSSGLAGVLTLLIGRFLLSPTDGAALVERNDLEHDVVVAAS